MEVSFISSISDIDRVDWSRGKDVQVEFGLDVGYGLGRMRSGGHLILSLASYLTLFQDENMQLSHRNIPQHD